MKYTCVAKAAIWFLFSVILAEGTPIVLIILLAKANGVPPLVPLLVYLGESTAPLIAFGILMAVAGDRVIEHNSLRSLFRDGVIPIGLILGCVVTLALQRHFFAANQQPNALNIFVGAFPTFVTIGVAAGIKHRDLRHAESDARIVSDSHTF